jgi:hypothetical protein
MLKYKKHDSGCGCSEKDGFYGSCSGSYVTSVPYELDSGCNGSNDELDSGCNGCKLKFSKLFNQQSQCNCRRYDCSYCNKRHRQSKKRGKSDGKRRSKRRSSRKRTLKTLRRSRRLK